MLSRSGSIIAFLFCGLLIMGFSARAFAQQAAEPAAAPAPAASAAPTLTDPQDPFAALNNAVPQSQEVQPAFAPLGGTLPVQGGLPGYGMTEEERLALQAKMEADAKAQQEKIRKNSFEAAIGTVLPLKPDEIREMLEFFRKSREAAEEPMIVPEAKIQIETISLDPGVAPSTIKTAPGHVTTLNILDITGMPWPVRDVSWAGNFDVTPPDEGGHVIRITPLSAHGIGNMSIQLVDLVTPITFSLETGLEISHYRFDARIPKMGPMARAPLIDDGGLDAVAGNTSLISFLEGVPPESSEMLSVQGTDGRTRVWDYRNQYFLRTPLVLLSPAWNASVKSADGMNVYALNEASVVLLSDHGQVVQAHIEPQSE